MIRDRTEARTERYRKKEAPVRPKQFIQLKPIRTMTSELSDLIWGRLGLAAVRAVPLEEPRAPSAEAAVTERSGLLQKPCLHAPEGRRGSHFFEHGFEIIKARRQKTRARDLSFFRLRQSTPSSGSAAAAVPERAPEAGAPQGTPLQGRRAQSLAERKRPASAAAPGCASAPAAASCERRGRRPCR